MKRAFKKILLYILTAMMILSAVISANVQTAHAVQFDIVMSVTSDKESASPDDIITVRVLVDRFKTTVSDDTNPLISGIQVEIPIDTEIFEFIDFVNTAEDGDDVPLFINTDTSISAHYDEAAKAVKCVGVESENVYIKGEAEHVLVMKFKLKVKSEMNNIKFSLGKTLFNNMFYKDGKEMLQYSIIQFTPVTSYGDVNNDGFINIGDAVALKKILAGMDINYHFWNSDVNCDNDVNTSDAVILLKHLAGMEVELGKKCQK